MASCSAVFFSTGGGDGGRPWIFGSANTTVGPASSSTATISPAAANFRTGATFGGGGRKVGAPTESRCICSYTASMLGRVTVATTMSLAPASRSNCATCPVVAPRSKADGEPTFGNRGCGTRARNGQPAEWVRLVRLLLRATRRQVLTAGIAATCGDARGVERRDDRRRCSVGSGSTMVCATVAWCSGYTVSASLRAQRVDSRRSALTSAINAGVSHDAGIRSDWAVPR